jgi:hypothetical protein
MSQHVIRNIQLMVLFLLSILQIKKNNESKLCKHMDFEVKLEEAKFHMTPKTIFI